MKPASWTRKVPTSWSRDGRFLLYTTIRPKTGSDLWVLPMGGDRKPSRVLATEFNELWGSFSPDGRWIAYQSNESGRSQIYARRFTPPGEGSPSVEAGIPISKDGGVFPRWRDDGKEIVFTAGSPVGLQVMAVEVSMSPIFRAGVARRLFQVTPGGVNGLFTGPGDFKRFLIPVPPQHSASQPEPISVILNWTAALQR